MTKFTLALCATTITLLTGCGTTNNLYSHRKDFQPKGRGGPWQTEYERLDRGTRRADADALQGNTARRALWREGRWHEYHWR